jgi:hypothetical protein
MSPRRHRLQIALTLLPLLAALTACGGGTDANTGGSRDAAGSSGAVAPAELAQRDAGTTGDFAAPKDGDGVQPAAATVVTRSVIATAQLRLSSKRLPDARQDAINLATGLHGFVADEQSRSDAHGRLDRVDLTLRVPAASFERALDGLAALGTVRERQQSVEDVTTQVIDNDARVRAQRASVANIRRLLARATTIAEIMSIEEQLAQRQAALDSLEQQQKWLADQTSMSTVQLTLVRPAAAKETHHAGFLGGLEDGWHALGRSAVALGTALGAALPFAVLLALVGGPAWAVLRRRRAVPSPPAEV